MENLRIMNASQEVKVEEIYEIVCFNCKNSFDALDAVWCGCLAAQQTLVCPSCLQCFCKAPKIYQDAVWDRAPQELWDSRIEVEQSLLLPRNPDPQDIVHPVVLVVDDEELILKLAVKAVESYGCTAISARDGVEAISMAMTYRPELILSDMLMPRMEGIQLCRFIKSNPDTEKIKVVLMTSLYTKSKHRVEMNKQSHPDDYLTKPLDFQKLYAILNKYLGKENDESPHSR